MSRRVWKIFFAVQAVAVAFSWAANYTLVQNPLISGSGVVLLVGGNILMLPGDLIGALAVQKFLFNTGLTIGEMSLVGIFIAVTINLATWLLCARLYRSARARWRTHQAKGTP